jgi:hypothetical protein
MSSFKEMEIRATVALDGDTRRACNNENCSKDYQHEGKCDGGDPMTDSERKQVLKSFACGVRGTNWTRVVHHMTAGKAKYSYWVDVREAWPDVKFTDITCAVIGRPVQTEKFEHTAKYRGVTFKIGDEVEVNGETGFVVDSNPSANFDVLFTSGKWHGQTMNCHPSEIKAVKP